MNLWDGVRLSDKHVQLESQFIPFCIYKMLHSDVLISGFEWDDDNIAHIQRHEFSPEEVKEIFTGNYKVRRTRQELYIALGQTLDGRFAFVVFRRLRKVMIRVITARDMEDKRASVVSSQVGEHS